MNVQIHELSYPRLESYILIDFQNHQRCLARQINRSKRRIEMFLPLLIFLFTTLLPLCCHSSAQHANYRDHQYYRLFVLGSRFFNFKVLVYSCTAIPLKYNIVSIRLKLFCAHTCIFFKGFRKVAYICEP